MRKALFLTLMALLAALPLRGAIPASVKAAPISRRERPSTSVTSSSA